MRQTRSRGLSHRSPRSRAVGSPRVFLPVVGVTTGRDVSRMRRRLTQAPQELLIRSSLLVTPRVAVRAYQRDFAEHGARRAARLHKHAPANVDAVVDEPYGPGPDERLDIYRPAASSEPLPAVVWVHGGGWFGGSKEEPAGYLKVIAGHGYAAIAVRYSLAPRHTYPTPTHQIMQALAHLRAHAPRLGLDPARIVIGGDSAGAQIAAQVGAVVTTPGYAEMVGVRPTVTAAHLRGLVLACGFYDLALAAPDRAPADIRRLLRVELWAHSGRRDFLADSRFATISVVDHVSDGFPPALITVGNDDGLEPHSVRLVERLQAAGAEPQVVFYSDDHRPPLGHEYQFELDTEPARQFLARLLVFLQERLVRDPP